MIKKIKKIWNAVLGLPILKQLLAWSKVYSFPGFSGVPIYNIVLFIYKETMRDNITTRANSVAFSLFLALFPFIIFLFTLLPILPLTANYMEIIQEYLSSILPNNANNYLLNLIESIVLIKREGLLSVGFLFAMIFASSGMLTLMYGFDKTYEKSYKERSYIRKRLVALALTGLISLLFIASFVLLIVGNLIVNYLDGHFGFTDITVLVITVIKAIVAFILLYLGITIIYRYGPSLRKRIPMINPGAILATVLSILTSMAFSYFVNNFGQYNELYGSIGALIVIMLWLQFNAFVILIGYELNASIAVNRDVLLGQE
ncbi:MAG: YihY/virulence factor BrkB family protein [Saprospiraceae bacterium]